MLTLWALAYLTVAAIVIGTVSAAALGPMAEARGEDWWALWRGTSALAVPPLLIAVKFTLATTRPPLGLAVRVAAVLILLLNFWALALAAGIPRSFGIESGLHGHAGYVCTVAAATDMHDERLEIAVAVCAVAVSLLALLSKRRT